MDNSITPPPFIDGSEPPGQSLQQPQIGTREPKIWAFALYFRPRAFFQHFVLRQDRLLTAIFAWNYGMVGAMDRIEIQRMRGTELPIGDSWLAYWSFVAGAGLFAALIYYLVGGWWYRMRLKFCGAVEPDQVLARRVYLTSAQVSSLPLLIVTGIQTTAYATPDASFGGDLKWWELLPMVFLFWSCWTSYVGARTVFAVRRLAALTWFLILPAILNVLALGSVLAIAFFALAQPPDLANQKKYQGELLQFSYPGNWTADASNDNYAPDTHMMVTPIQDAFVDITLYAAQGTLRQEIESTLGRYQQSVQNWQPQGEYERWGSHRGLGIRGQCEIEQHRYELQVFTASIVEGWNLEVVQMCLQEDAVQLEEGFRLLRSTLEIQY